MEDKAADFLVSKEMDMFLNKDLRGQIVDMVVEGKMGHIPSSFSIVDILKFNLH